MKNYWVVENDKLNTQTQNILNEYLLSLKLAGKSQLTINRYRGLLENSLVDLSKPIEDLTTEDILSYIHNNYASFKECTINSNISILSSFFRFCKIEEYIDDIPIKKRWRPRLQKPLPKYLDKIELAKVKLESEKTSLRNRTIFEFLLSSGCRVAEAQGLNLDDIDLENRTEKVIGKGKKIRFVHFTETYAILLEQYIESHPNGVEALFLGRNNNRLTIRTIQRIVTNLGEKAGLLIKISPHKVRHTFATVLLSKGAPLEFIGEELGHEDDNTTRIYARLPQQQMISLYRRYMG